MADPLALLDRVIAELLPEDSSRCSRSQPQQNAPTGTVNSLLPKGVPVVPVVPVVKQEICRKTDTSCREDVSTHTQEEAPLSLSSKTTGTTGTTGSGQEFRGFQSSRRISPNGNNGNSPADPEPTPSQHADAWSTPFDEGAAIGAGVPRDWAEGVARLQRLPCPRGIDPERWRQVIDDARRFIERRAVEAAARGWETTDIFGVHPLKPAARTDCMGLVWLLRGREVIEITAETARIGLPTGAVHTYSRRARTETVPMWQLQQGGDNRPSALRRLLVCCQCGEAVVGPVSAWLSGEPVHRECGERVSARPESTAGAVEAAA